MRTTQVTASALLLASICLSGLARSSATNENPVAHATRALPPASTRVSDNPVEEMSLRLQQMYDQENVGLQADTIAAAAAISERFHLFTPETLALFDKVNDQLASDAQAPWELVKAEQPFTVSEDERDLFIDNMRVVFEADVAGGAFSTASAIPTWLMDSYTVAVAPKGPWIILEIYIHWLYGMYKDGQKLQAVCDARYAFYIKCLKYNCEQTMTPPCTLAVVNPGGGNIFCVECQCPPGAKPNGTTPIPPGIFVFWKSTPGEFADPLGRCLGKNALCGAN